MKTNKVFLFTLLLVIVAVASGCISVQRTPSKVSVVDQKLLVDGQEFYVKGVTYSPVPVGSDPEKPTRTFVDWLNHPEIYRNDFALMKKAGINTIRVMVDNSSVTPTRRMLDAAHEYNIKVIMNYEGPLRSDLSGQRTREQVKSHASTMIRNYKDHPAILMWMIGNEVNYWYPKDGDVRDWYTLLEEITQEAKKIDPNHPVATANNALSHMEYFIELSPSVDIFATNAYSLSQGSWNWIYDSYRSYQTGKPILIAEAGMDSWNSRANFDDEGLQAAMIQMILSENANRPEGIGLVIFEWVDEWWKSGDPFTQDGTDDWTMENQENAVDSWFSEEYFGIVRQQADTNERIPKYAYYAVREEWGKNPVNSPPTLHGVTTTEREGVTYFVADIVTYGNVNATASLRYTAGGKEETTNLVNDGRYYSAPINTGGKDSAVRYVITIEDMFGQQKAVEGRVG
jgi:hypothetical protein